MPKDFQYYVWHCFYVAIGVGSNFSVLSFYVDRDCVSQQRFEYVIRIGTIEGGSVLIGADRESRNHTKLHLMSLAIYSASLRDNDLDNMWTWADAKLQPKVPVDELP